MKWYLVRMCASWLCPINIGHGFCNISRILLVYQWKCCSLLGWAIAHYQPLVCSGWNSSTKWWRFFVLPKETERRTFTVSCQKKFKLLKKWCARVHNFSFKCQLNRDDLFKDAKFKNTSRNNWKPLFEVNFSENSTKTITLVALDFYCLISNREGLGTSL